MMRSGHSYIFQLTKVFVFCLLAVSVAAEPSSSKAELKSTARANHHESARFGMSSWATGLGPATLITIGSIIIIFVIFALIIATIFSNPVSGKMSPAYDDEMDSYSDYGWNMYHQRFTRQLNDAAQTVMKAVGDMTTKFE